MVRISFVFACVLCVVFAVCVCDMLSFFMLPLTPSSSLLPLLSQLSHLLKHTTLTVIDHPSSNAIVCSIGYQCKPLQPTSYVSKLFMVSPTGVDECCSTGLSYVNPTYCKSKTMGVFSRMWFVDYSAKLCVSLHYMCLIVFCLKYSVLLLFYI